MGNFKIDGGKNCWTTWYNKLTTSGTVAWPVYSYGYDSLEDTSNVYVALLPTILNLNLFKDVNSTTNYKKCILSVFFNIWVLVLKGLLGLHRTVQLQLLQHFWLGHRLELLWYWMVCLGNEQRSLCHFWDCIQELNFRPFCWLWWLLHFFWGIPAHSSRYNGHLS